MRKLVRSLAGLFNPEDKEKDVKLLAFAAVVVAAIVWLSLALRRPEGITPSWVDAFAWLCALVGLGGAGWAAVEKWKGGKDATQPKEGDQP